ncbi:MAG TPA: squalene/phytoene synthase family protein [Chloroflexota bacterium]
MNTSIASEITRAASKQTYYTIRFLVDRERVDDAYRAYAYFRWVDDVLDAPGCSEDLGSAAVSAERTSFLDQQQSLLHRCLRGARPRAANAQEQMLVDLLQHNAGNDAGLRAYVQNMMLVMEFDVRRRGRLVSRTELDQYTRWLAVAVTEAMHFFIGNGAYTPHDETRYLAVSGAHIAHMLRDARDDLQAGYYNVPREVLEDAQIGPGDVESEAYRAWVKSRVATARACFAAGRDYLSRVESFRSRLAGLAYMARFELVLDTIEKDGFGVRPAYRERRSPGSALRMAWLALTSAASPRSARPQSRPATQERRGVA